MKLERLSRKILATVLAVCMTFGCAVTGVGSYIGLSTTVSAAEGDTGVTADGFKYTEKSDGTLEITGYKGSENSIIIPSSIGGKAVTSIGDKAFYSSNTLTSVTIPKSVTSIGGYVFYQCDSLTSVTIPDSVTSIGSSAFFSCDALTSITIPDSVISIGSSAFYGCKALTSVTIPNSVTFIGNFAFCHCTALKSITVSSDHSMFLSQDGVLFNKDKTVLITYPCGKSETTYTVPDSVISIKSEAFYYCAALTSVTIPDSVTSIGYRTFSYCAALTSVTLGNSVTSIGDEVFYRCAALTSVTIPNSVKSIDDFAFGYCDSLTSITIPNSVTSIGTYAFYGCKALTSVTLGNSVTSIGDYAFCRCDGLTSVTIPNSVTSIGEWAFYNCAALKSAIIMSSDTSIGVAAFKEVSDDFIIHCNAGSRAESYAKYDQKNYDTSLYNCSTISNSVVYLNSELAVYCGATGGEGSYEYQIEMRDASSREYRILRPYSTNPTLTLPPRRTEGEFVICVLVKDSSGTVVAKSFDFTVTARLANNTTISTTTITLGETVTISGDASGGIMPYQYSFLCRRSSAAYWTTLTSYGTTSTRFWKPTKTGTFTIRTKIKDATDEEIIKDFTLTVNPVLANNSTLSKTGINFGDSLTITGKASGGTSPYQYSFLCKHSSATSWTTLSSYGTNPTRVWKPTKSGTYTVRSKIKDANGKEVIKDFTLTVNVIFANNSTMSKTTINYGDALTITGKAVNGTSPYQYSFLCKHSTETKWTTLTSYGTTSKRIWQPKKTGTYTVRTKVKDATGKEVIKDFTLTVK